MGKEKINYRFNFNCAQACEKDFWYFFVLVVTILVSNSVLSYKLHFSLNLSVPFY